jgi:hypothetical protein
VASRHCEAAPTCLVQRASLFRVVSVAGVVGSEYAYGQDWEGLVRLVRFGGWAWVCSPSLPSPTFSAFAWEAHPSGPRCWLPTARSTLPKPTRPNPVKAGRTRADGAGAGAPVGEAFGTAP